MGREVPTRHDEDQRDGEYQEAFHPAERNGDPFGRAEDHGRVWLRCGPAVCACRPPRWRMSAADGTGICALRPGRRPSTRGATRAQGLALACFAAWLICPLMLCTAPAAMIRRARLGSSALAVSRPLPPLTRKGEASPAFWLSRASGARMNSKPSVLRLRYPPPTMVVRGVSTTSRRSEATPPLTSKRPAMQLNGTPVSPPPSRRSAPPGQLASGLRGHRPLVTATSIEPLAELSASRVLRPPPRRRRSMSPTASRSEERGGGREGGA